MALAVRKCARYRHHLPQFEQCHRAYLPKPLRSAEIAASIAGLSLANYQFSLIIIKYILKPLHNYSKVNQYETLFKIDLER